MTKTKRGGGVKTKEKDKIRQARQGTKEKDNGTIDLEIKSVCERVF